MASKFHLRSSGSQYYFNLSASNGEVILTSERYTTKQSALNGIDSVRRNAPLSSRYEKRISRANQPYFVLKAGNGEIVGTSEMYSSAAARDNGIEAVKKAAPSALLVDHAESNRSAY